MSYAFRNKVGRFGKVEGIAATVLFLCPSAASVNTGIDLPVDGGFTAT